MCPPAHDPAAAARKLLDAFRSADAALLEKELSRLGRLPAPPAGSQAGGDERWELLGALCDALCTALDRMRRGRTNRLEGAAAQLRLLHHLAAG